MRSEASATGPGSSAKAGDATVGAPTFSETPTDPSSDPSSDTSTAPSTESPEARSPRTSYVEILRSSAWIGGSSVLNIVIGILRTKVMAVLLGPAGFGLLGIFASITDLARSVAQMGTGASGVRQIAQAAGTGDEVRIAQTITVLRWLVVALGVIGALSLVLLADPIARLTFGDGAQAGAIALLSLAVLLRLIADGQGALLQGLRRISDLAKAGVAGSLLGTIASIPLVYTLGESGIVPSLIAVAASTLAATWWYSSRVELAAVPAVGAGQFQSEAGALLKLGFAFMCSGLLMMGAAYVVRMLVLRDAGLEAAGLYQAAWTVGGLYVGLVLQAMGTDFYPRLVAVAQDNEQASRLVNEQTQVSLLLAAPGVIATLTLASLVMSLLYSEQFRAGVDLLRWICLGMALRVITWPIGFIIVAKGRQVVFLLTELAWTVVHVGLAWYFIGQVGRDGAGIAFFGSYLFHGLMIYPIVNRIAGFRWSPANLRTGCLFMATIALVFVALEALPTFWGLGLGAVATAASSLYCMQKLSSLLSPATLPSGLRRLVTWGQAKSGSTTRLAAAEQGIEP